MKIFFSFARQAFHSTAIYRFDFWLRVVGNFVWMVSVYWLWTILYTQRPGAFGISLEQMVTYAMLSAVMEIILRPGFRVGYEIAHKVKSGEIVMDILKPLDFHQHFLARTVGQSLFFAATLGLPSYLVAHFLLGLRLPVSLAAGLLFLLSFVLGFGIVFSLNYLLGLLAVFTIDIRSISWAYYALVRFFSGSEVPIWLFPLFLQAVAGVLPFKSIYATPLSIYINQLSPSQVGGALALQVVWLAALVLAGQVLWRRAYRQLTVQGG